LSVPDLPKGSRDRKFGRLQGHDIERTASIHHRELKVLALRQYFTHVLMQERQIPTHDRSYGDLTWAGLDLCEFRQNWVRLDAFSDFAQAACEHSFPARDSVISQRANLTSVVVAHKHFPPFVPRN